ncbi:MAG: hypothetical protein HQ508_01510 [Candidatus Marinimicrobia bacterium]|nr:hypothetical protein [Candidatus Neomarinimicrobiota bacterium]
MKLNKTIIRQLIGGAIFVFGAYLTKEALGGEATRGIVVILLGIMLGAGVGLPKSWTNDSK